MPGLRDRNKTQTVGMFLVKRFELRHEAAYRLDVDVLAAQGSNVVAVEDTGDGPLAGQVGVDADREDAPGSPRP